MSDEQQDFKPVDVNTLKSSTSRIDLSRATIPRSPTAGTIRVGANPKKATSRIDISTIPGAAAKAATSRVGLGAPVDEEDIYKRRTVLMDTSSLPLTPAASGQPRTVRISGRPTVRISGSPAAAATFSPGRSPSPSEATGDETGEAERPTIKLKRPGGGISVSAASTTFTAPEPIFTIQEEDDTPGGIWAVAAILSALVLFGLLAMQVWTMQHSVY